MIRFNDDNREYKKCVMNLLFLILGFLIGCAALTWGADQFVKSSTVIARHYRVSPLVVGMILVGFGTSCPELIVSLLASLKQAPEIAIGNVLGSNIANKALVGGVAALLMPLTDTFARVVSRVSIFNHCHRHGRCDVFVRCVNTF